MEIEQTEPGVRWRAVLDEHEAEAFLGRLHRDVAWFTVGQDVPPEVVRELGRALRESVGLPLMVKAVPGTARHEQLSAAGATAYQICPPSQVDGGRPDNAAWAAAADPPGSDDPDRHVELRPMSDLAADDVLELFVQLYARVHADWSPLADEQAGRDHFGPVLAEALDADLSRVVLRDGRATAAAFVISEPGAACVVAETPDPDAATARDDVARVMKAAVRATAGAGRAMYFDGHLSDPHYPAVLATVPHVTGRGLHLLRLG